MIEGFKNRFTKRGSFISILFGVLYSLAMYSWNYGIENSTAMVFLGILRFTLVFFGMQLAIIPLMNKASVILFEDEAPEYDQKRFLFNILFFAICWLPFLLIKYPAGISVDAWWGLYEFNYNEITGVQPIGYVGFTAFLVKLFGSNIGIFVLSVFGYFLYSYSFGYFITVLDSLKIKKRVKTCTMIICVTSPYILGYIGVVIKDTLFTAGIMMITLLLIKVSRFGKTSVFDCVNFAFFAFVMAFFRPNGVHILIAVAIVYMWEIIKRNFSIKPLICMIISVIIAVALSNIMNLALDVHKAENRNKEMLSFPFQQTAMYVREYGDDVTEKEKQIIDSVLVYDSLAARYNERISDPVKLLYTGKDELLKDYFVVWWNQFLRHPDSYFKAFWAQNHYMFDPVASAQNENYVEDIAEYYELSAKYSVVGWIGEEAFFQEFSCPDFLYDARHIVVSLCCSMTRFPIPWFNSNIALSCYIVLFCFLMSIRKKNKFSLIYYVTILATIVFTFLGPAIQGHPRYMFLITYIAPLILILYLRDVKDNNFRP